MAWTPDLSLTFTKVRDYDEGETSGFKLVMTDNADGSRTVLIPQGVGFGGGEGSFHLGGAFDGDSKVVFDAKGLVPVTSGPAPSSTKFKNNVYLYDRDNGELTLAGLLPDSACAIPPCVPAEGSQLPPGFNTYVQDGHAVSPNGAVYFTGPSSGRLYLRREVAGPGATTELVSSSHKTEGTGPGGVAANSPQPVSFQGATPDGSKAFFTSTEELTNDANTGPEGPEESPGHDLYRYDAASGGLIDLVPDSSDPNGADVLGVFGYSNDGSYVYFAANGDLDGSGPAASGNCTQGYPPYLEFAGSCSAYLWQEDGTGACATAGGCVSFVAPLDTKEGRASSDGYNWAGLDEEHMKTSRVSADGRILVFRSQLKLTSYDSTPPAHSEICLYSQRCAEFYRYDAESGQVTCLTCNPSGAPPVGAPDLKNPDMFHAPTGRSIFLLQNFLSRNLSPDGNRFFFQSTDKLVSADVNGEVSCEEEPVKFGAGPSSAMSMSGRRRVRPVATAPLPPAPIAPPTAAASTCSRPGPGSIPPT